MTSLFKSINRAYRRGHVEFSTEKKHGKQYITGAYRKARVPNQRHQNQVMTGYIVRLKDNSVNRFIPYGR